MDQTTVDHQQLPAAEVVVPTPGQVCKTTGNNTGTGWEYVIGLSQQTTDMIYWKPMCSSV